MSQQQEDQGASANADRATDAPHGAANASPPSGSVSTGAASIADVLDAAADLIEPEGAWTQCMFGINPGTPCCVVGAIGRALATSSITLSEDWVNQHFEPLVGMDADALEEWNDAPERTQPEVVAKLREAASLACAGSPS